MPSSLTVKSCCTIGEGICNIGSLTPIEIDHALDCSSLYNVTELLNDDIHDVLKDDLAPARWCRPHEKLNNFSVIIIALLVP
ncbi:hypothetical protein Bca4012_034949 [Brassica carinata]|uniref:Uncharacterized protein n=1 Tax=Brassica carinata TaxID=52824 RepID=A0A8X7RP28_BRACI|nr:hypothetical protein Bca52824_050202 [Brassica carinata]